MMNIVRYVMPMMLPMLLVLPGCKFATKKELEINTSRIRSLESRAQSQGSQISSNVGSIRDARSDTESLGTRLSQRDSELASGIDSVLQASKSATEALGKKLSYRDSELALEITNMSQMSKDEDQRLRSKIADEASARRKSTEGLNDSIVEALAGETRLQRIIGDLLQAEKELLVSLVEIKQVVDDLKKRGTLTDKDIQASKAARLEAAVWAKRIDSIKAQLDALSKPRKTKESHSDK